MSYQDDSYLLANARALSEAQMRNNAANRPSEVQVLNLDLSQARSENTPLPINLQFRSIFIRDASDTSTTVLLRVISTDTTQESSPMTKNDGFVMPFPVNGYLHWPAQPGKSIKILLYATGEFRSGSQISQNGGGVSINEGSTAAPGTIVTLVAATAAQIAPSKLDRKTATIENKTGNDIFVGDATVTTTGVTEGIKVSPGDKIVWRNTAPLWAISALGGRVARLEEA